MTMLKETREKVERAKEDFFGKWFTESDLCKVDPETFQKIYPSLSTLKRYGLIENIHGKQEYTFEELIEFANDCLNYGYDNGNDIEEFVIENGKIYKIYEYADYYRFK